MSLQYRAAHLALGEVRVEGEGVVQQQTALLAPLARAAIGDPLREVRARQRVGHGETHVVERQRAGEAQCVKHGVVGLAGVAEDEERPDLKAGTTSGLYRVSCLRRRDLLVHQLQDLVVAGLDAEEDAEAARVSHLLCGRVVEGVDPTQALPQEVQAAAPDLLADLEDAAAVQSEYVIGE